MQRRQCASSAKLERIVQGNATHSPASRCHARPVSFLKQGQMLVLLAEPGHIQNPMQLHALLAHRASSAMQC